MPLAKHFHEALVRVARLPVPAKHLCAIFRACSKRSFKFVSPEVAHNKAAHRQHARLPASTAACLHASKQSWRQQPIHDLLNGLMIDNNVDVLSWCDIPNSFLGWVDCTQHAVQGFLGKRKKPLSHQDFFAISILPWSLSVTGVGWHWLSECKTSTATTPTASGASGECASGRGGTG